MRKACSACKPLQNEYLLAKIGFETAEDSPLKGLKNRTYKNPGWLLSISRMRSSNLKRYIFGNDIILVLKTFLNVV